MESRVGQLGGAPRVLVQKNEERTQKGFERRQELDYERTPCTRNGGHGDVRQIEEA